MEIFPFLNQSDFSPVKHIKMTVWTSFLWKINMQLAEKWPEMVAKWAFVIVIRFDSDYTLVIPGLHGILAKFNTNLIVWQYIIAI